MIDFRCKHCGWPVRAADDCAGRSRQCPFCGTMLAVPSREQTAARGGVGRAAVALLAATEQAHESGIRGSSSPPAPAPPAKAAGMDSLDVIEIDPCARTDAFPAQRGDAANTAPLGPEELRRQQEILHRQLNLSASAANRRRLILTAIAVAVVCAIVATVFLTVFRR